MRNFYFFQNFGNHFQFFFYFKLQCFFYNNISDFSLTKCYFIQRTVSHSQQADFLASVHIKIYFSYFIWYFRYYMNCVKSKSVYPKIIFTEVYLIFFLSLAGYLQNHCRIINNLDLILNFLSKFLLLLL